MAKPRKATATPTQTTKENIKMALVLDPARITELQAGSKQRGLYTDELNAFIARENRGEEVDLTDGALAGKKPQSVKTGFENARKKLSDELKPTIQVILNEDHVYLINKAVEA
jgi:hypothetical protein